MHPADATKQSNTTRRGLIVPEKFFILFPFRKRDDNDSPLVILETSEKIMRGREKI